MDPLSAALRAQDVHLGLSDLVGPFVSTSFNVTRLVGMAAHLALTIRGRDVLSYEELEGIAAGLGIDALVVDKVLRILEEVDFVTVQARGGGRKVVHEKVSYFDVGYERLGELWIARKKTGIEEATVYILDRLSQAPGFVGDLEKEVNLTRDEFTVVREVGLQGSYLGEFQVEQGNLLYSPLFWEANPEAWSRLLSQYSADEIVQQIGSVRSYQGTPVDPTQAPVLVQAASLGILPAPAVESVSGRRTFAFTPYVGGLINARLENTILEKARAIVAAVRYGEGFAGASRIRWPEAILRALLDPGRQYQLRPHTEHHRQYAMLASRGIVRIEPVPGSSSWHTVQLIDTEDNKKAVTVALQLLQRGETLEGRQHDLTKGATVAGAAAVYTDPLRNIKTLRPAAPLTPESWNRFFDLMRGGGID